MQDMTVLTFEQDFERAIAEDDDSAACALLASGTSIYVSRETTPPGHVVRVHPDGREELARIDHALAARILGR